MTEHGSKSAETDNIAALIRHAGARDPIDVGRMESARLRIGSHWERVATVRRRRRVLRWTTTVAAASIAVVLVAVSQFAQLATDNPLPEVQVTRVVGTVTTGADRLQEGARIGVDSAIETGSNGRAAMRLPTGHVLRMNFATSIRMTGANRLRLERGELYFDSADSLPSDSVFIETPWGTVRDVGTRFLVRVEDRQLLLGVRDGFVELDRPGSSPIGIDPGQSLQVEESGETISRALDPNTYAWIDSVFPLFELDGSTLDAYLSWYARAKGIDLQYADASTRRFANQTILSGSIEGLSLDDSLAVVAPTVPFEFERIERVLHVRSR